MSTLRLHEIAHDQYVSPANPLGLHPWIKQAGDILDAHPWDDQGTPTLRQTLTSGVGAQITNACGCYPTGQKAIIGVRPDGDAVGCSMVGPGGWPAMMLALPGIDAVIREAASLAPVYLHVGGVPVYAYAGALSVQARTAKKRAWTVWIQGLGVAGVSIDSAPACDQTHGETPNTDWIGHMAEDLRMDVILEGGLQTTHPGLHRYYTGAYSLAVQGDELEKAGKESNRYDLRACSKRLYWSLNGGTPAESRSSAIRNPPPGVSVIAELAGVTGAAMATPTTARGASQ